MRDVLKQLYRGEISGASAYIRAGDSEESHVYKELLSKLLEYESALESFCIDKGKAALQAYKAASANVTEYEKEELFIFAFRLGAKMMMKTLSKEDGALTYYTEME